MNVFWIGTRKINPDNMIAILCDMFPFEVPVVDSKYTMTDLERLIQNG